MFNYVNRFLVGKSTGANTGTSLQTITAGDILFINGNDQSVLTSATISAIGDNVPVYVAMGISLGVPRLSFPIRRKEVRNANRQAYRAKAEQIDTFSANGLTAGANYKLIIVLKDEMRTIADRQTKLEIDYVATGTGATDAAALATKITNFRTTKGMLVGSVSGTDVIITGQPVPAESVLDEYQYVAFSTSFAKMAALGDNLGYPGISNGVAVTVTTTQKADGGSGVPAQLLKTELEASGYLGNNDLTSFDRNPMRSRIDLAASYDLIDILHFDVHQGDHEFSMSSPLRTTIATNSGSTLSTFVETMLDAFLTKSNTNVLTTGGDLDDAGGM